MQLCNHIHNAIICTCISSIIRIYFFNQYFPNLIGVQRYNKKSTYASKLSENIIFTLSMKQHVYIKSPWLIAAKGMNMYANQIYFSAFLAQVFFVVFFASLSCFSSLAISFSWFWIVLSNSFNSSFSIVVGYCSSTRWRKSERMFM